MNNSSNTVSIPLDSDKVERWHYRTDVLVVGAGGAGSCAALEAARSGARVMLLERASGAGGTTALCSGHVYAGGGTRVQQHNDFDDSIEDLYQYLLACSETPDEAKCRRYADESLAHFSWLEQQGVPFNNGFYPQRHSLQPDDRCLIWSGNEKAWPFNQRAKPAPRGHKAAGSGDAGHLIMKALLAQLEREAHCELLCDSRVSRLIVNTQGAVVGVIARRFGEDIAIKADRGVILSAGGFIQNRVMVNSHAPQLNDPVMPHGNPYDDGSGIQLGISAGGAAIHMDQVFVTLPFYPPESLTFGLLVNRHGQRFVNEDCYHARIGDACMKQTDGKVWLIIDNKDFAQPDINKHLRQEGATHLIEHVATEESIDDLERELQLPPGSLSDTVSAYNDDAAKGEDRRFHKSPAWLRPLDQGPFAAFDCSVGVAPYIGFTLGGLWTSVDGEVLDAAGAPVPGLYAAGRNSCGLPRSAAGYASGLSVADATFFGRLAGRHAAAISTV